MKTILAMSLILFSCQLVVSQDVKIPGPTKEQRRRVEAELDKRDAIALADFKKDLSRVPDKPLNKSADELAEAYARGWHLWRDKDDEPQFVARFIELSKGFATFQCPADGDIDPATIQVKLTDLCKEHRDLVIAQAARQKQAIKDLENFQATETRAVQIAKKNNQPFHEFNFPDRAGAVPSVPYQRSRVIRNWTAKRLLLSQAIDKATINLKVAVTPTEKKHFTSVLAIYQQQLDQLDRDNLSFE